MTKLITYAPNLAQGVSKIPKSLPGSSQSTNGSMPLTIGYHQVHYLCVQSS